MDTSPKSRRTSMKGLRRTFVGSMRLGTAIVASLAICVWPVWASNCCCHAPAVSQTTLGPRPCCQARDNEAHCNEAHSGQTHRDASSGHAASACCSLTHVKCASCDGVQHECPCEVRDQNLDHWVGTRLVPVEAPELEHEVTWFAGSPSIGPPPSVSPSILLAHEVRPISLSAIDRCALLCRWLN